MKRLRAVVEITVPDKVELNERQFAKQLRRKLTGGLNLMPHEQATRPLEFKEFSRVVQYGPDGARIAATKPPSSFERLVLFGLLMIVSMVASPKRRVDPNYRLWVSEVRATLDPPDEPA